MLKNGDIVHSRYKVISIIGKGGSGCVYLVWDLNIGKKWALKEIRTKAAGERHLADSEIGNLKQLDSPSIPRIVDAWQDDDTCMIVSDYIEGISLGQYIKEGPISRSKTVNISIQIAKAIRYLHTQDPPILFLDLKPDNIMLKADGKAYLIDFGIASEISVGPWGFGTLGYASPEQYMGTDKKCVDEKADIFAFGITYFSMRTGCDPDPDVQKTSNLIRTNRYLKEREKRFIRDCIHINPDQRIASMDQVILRLEHIESGFIGKNVKLFACAFLISFFLLLNLTTQNQKTGNDYVLEMLDRAAEYMTDGEYDLNGLKVIEEYVNSGKLSEEEGYYTFLLARSYFEKYSMYREAEYYFERLPKEEYPQKKYYLEMCDMETSFDFDAEKMEGCIEGLKGEVLKMADSEEKFEDLLFLSFCYEHYFGRMRGYERSEEILEYIDQHLRQLKNSNEDLWIDEMIGEAARRKERLRDHYGTNAL